MYHYVIFHMTQIFQLIIAMFDHLQLALLVPALKCVIMEIL